MISKAVTCMIMLLAFAFSQGEYTEKDVVRLSPRLLNYQGYLTDTLGIPVTNPSVSMTFTIFDAASSGNQKWSETQSSVSVNKGIFHVLLGSVMPIPDSVFLNSTNRWLELTVSGQTLTPRTRIVSAGYAYTATYADTAQYSRNAAPDGDWNLVGNVLYTADNYAIAKHGDSLYGGYNYTHVNLGLACTTGTAGSSYRYCTVGGGEFNAAGGNYATVAGGYDNTASYDYATVGGGSNNTANEQCASVGGGDNNLSNSGYTTISGGRSNIAGNWYAAIGGGEGNAASGQYATIGGGSGNNIDADLAFIGGGSNNAANGYAATVGGGEGNAASGQYATVGGGSGNNIDADLAFIGGGSNNAANGYAATVGGGDANTAGGYYTTIAGGCSNTTSNVFGFVGGGEENTAGYYANVGGGFCNYNVGDYSVIAGGYMDTITETGDYSYLFGINSILTQDSTIMLDMPHVWFGDEATGYEFPRERSTEGSYVMVSDGSGQLYWSTAGDNDWSFRVTDGADTTLQTGGSWGLARAGNTLFGNRDSTHVNLGVASTTGTPGINYKYCTVAGGLYNSASRQSSTVGGGDNNAASNSYATVAGGYADTASGGYATVGGGCRNVASNWYTTTAGGWLNTASGLEATVGGGRENIASGMYATVAGGCGDTVLGTWGGVSFGTSNRVGDTPEDTASLIAGGYNNDVTGKFSSIGGGRENSVAANYASIIGGYADTIFAGADNSFLFGINSNLTQDSTIMLDMPHVWFGDEATGYEFPRQRGVDGQIMVSNGSGQLSWSAAGDNDWSFLISDGADTTLQMGGRWGLARAGNTLYGNADSTHVNFGVECTTGASGFTYKYCTVGGGRWNRAGGSSATVGGGYNNSAIFNYTTIGGGYRNIADTTYATVGGGYQNTASAYMGTIGGGYFNTASGDYAAVSGGYSNLASADGATVTGGVCNIASNTYAVVGGGAYDTASGYAAIVGGGYGNNASGMYATVGGGYTDSASGTSATIGGGYRNTAKNTYATVSGGNINTASGGCATVGGGNTNTASGSYATVGGGRQNYNAGDYSVIVGGYADSITTTGDYSFLFGINANLTQDSTIMLDMPHVWFGDEAMGYEFPRQRGVDGQIMVSNGSGQLSWSAAGDNDWSFRVFDGADTTLQMAGRWGLARAGNVLRGNADSTHVNFGVACTTGALAFNYKYCTVAGGLWNSAQGTAATVGGGYSNMADSTYANVGGGQNNTASGQNATVGGGYDNTASRWSATVGGGYFNTASGTEATVSGGAFNIASGYQATVSGGDYNTASGQRATVGGGNSNTASNYSTTVGGGQNNTASSNYTTVGGGYGNDASGNYATVAGGAWDTTQARYSFATNYSTLVSIYDTNSAAFTTSHTIAMNQVRAAAFSTGTVDFAMDHPDDPMNKILNQYGVSSDEVQSQYSGAIILDDNGRATVSLPDYFDDINRNPRILLTGVGSADVVFVAEKIKNNQFVIGGKPDMEVYWQVTAERKDIHAEIARIQTPVVQEKKGDLRGHSIDDDAMIGMYDGLHQKNPALFQFKTEEGRRVHEQSKRLVEGRE